VGLRSNLSDGPPSDSSPANARRSLDRPSEDINRSTRLDPNFIELVEGAFDPEGEQVVLNSVEETSAAGGKVFPFFAEDEDNLESFVEYEPPVGFEGLDSFSFTLRDQSGAISIAEVSVIVASTARKAFTLFSQLHPDRRDFGKVVELFSFHKRSEPYSPLHRVCTVTTTTITSPDGTTTTADRQEVCGAWDLEWCRCKNPVASHEGLIVSLAHA
jgi:hypothetical protein